jgi:septal ring factor EnvC (AmiA/AmiB activator)
MIETLVAGAIGPYGAICVLLLILYVIYKVFIDHAVPLAKTYVDNQQTAMKDILTEHKADREVFQSTITTLAKRQDKLEDDVEDIKTDVKKIMDKI